VAKHLGKKTRLALIQRFLGESKEHLKRNGSIFLVVVDSKNEIRKICDEIGLIFKILRVERTNIAKIKSR
jgi:16S rRNA G1207 methylase RsmC